MPEAGDSTATITFGAPPKADADERASLNPADAAAVDALPGGSALLVVQRGPGAGSRYLLDTDLSTVGRHPESDIFLDDITVSRRHVGVPSRGRELPGPRRRQPQRHLPQRRPGRRRELQNGDEVRIGKFRLIFFASDAKGTDRCARRPASPIGQASRRASRRSSRTSTSRSRRSGTSRTRAVEPERTPSGYRKYSVEDMEKLRYIIRAQREHYLPLQVIRSTSTPSTAASSRRR